MATQFPGTDRGFHSIIQGGAPDHKYYTDILKTSAAGVYPGRIVTTEGDTDGECHLATAADGLIAGFHIVLGRVGAKPQDIDTAIASGEYIECLRPAGGRFIVAATAADEDSAVEFGEPFHLEADGMLRKFVYTDGTAQTDSLIDGFWRAAEVTADVAGTDKVQLIYW